MLLFNFVHFMLLTTVFVLHCCTFVIGLLESMCLPSEHKLLVFVVTSLVQLLLLKQITSLYIYTCKKAVVYIHVNGDMQ